MSTYDPRQVRAERQAREAKSPGNFIALLAIGAVHCALWLTAGFGLGILLDSFRLMTVNQVGAWSSEFDNSPSQLLGIGAIAVGAVLGVYFTRRLSRFGLGASMLIPFCTGLFGITLGLVLFIPSWSPPESVGEKTAFTEGGQTVPWQSDSWTAYYVPYWLPALFGILFLLVAIATIRASIVAHRKNDRMQDLASRGTKVQGMVTEAIATGTEIQGMPRIQFTAKFRDSAGTERWVTKKSTFPPAATPRAGDAVVVWFNALAPADEKQIMVGFGPEATEVALSGDAVAPIAPIAPLADR
jgi:type IV secretory pathway TrbD component